MPCRARPAAARATGRSVAGWRPSASVASRPNCTQSANCSGSRPAARANCSGVSGGPPPSASPSTAGGGGTEPGPPATVRRGSPRSRASRCSLMTRSGRYWSRWAARTYRSRLTSARENFRYPEGVRCGWTRSSDSRYRILLIVTSGKSSRRTASTSPMVSRGVRSSAASPSAPPRSGMAVTSLSRRRPGRGRRPVPRWCGRPPERALASGRLAGAGAREVHEAKLPDLHLVTPGEVGDVHRLAVDVRAVEAAHVVDREAATLTVELHVPPAHGDVVEEDVTVRVPTGRRDVLVEQKSAAGVGSALDYQQGRAGRERLHRAGVRVGGRLEDLRLVAGVLAAHLGDHAGRLADPLLGERRAALRAEATALGVPVATSSAVHVCLLLCEGPRRGPPNGPRTTGGRRAGRLAVGRPPRTRRTVGHATSRSARGSTGRSGWNAGFPVTHRNHR